MKTIAMRTVCMKERLAARPRSPTNGRERQQQQRREPTRRAADDHPNALFRPVRQLPRLTDQSTPRTPFR
jgi:hypothetical protein